MCKFRNEIPVRNVYSVIFQFTFVKTNLEDSQRIKTLISVIIASFLSKMCMFHDEISVRNVFTVIFYICLCKDKFRRKLTNENIDFSNYCYVLIQNVHVSRRNSGSEHFYCDFTYLPL
jgi:hypothetical protein